MSSAPDWTQYVRDVESMILAYVPESEHLGFWRAGGIAFARDEQAANELRESCEIALCCAA